MSAAAGSGLGPFLDSFFLAVTHLGSGTGVVLLAFLYCWWMDPQGGRRLGITLGISFLVNLAAKELFALPRPYDLETGLAGARARATASGYGFPSGHTQASATFCFFLAFLHRRRWLLWAAAVPVLLVGGSRVYLGVHFPLDVFGGLALGLALAWAGAHAPPPPRPPMRWGLVLILAGLPIAVGIGSPAAQALGLTLGAHLSRSDHAVPVSRPQRLLVAVGGLALLGLLYGLLDPLLSGLSAALDLGARGEAARGYLRSLALAFAGFDLWPRQVLGVDGPAPEPPGGGGG